MQVRQDHPARARRTRLRLAVLAACACGLFASQASPAQAASHDYCNWDGTIVTTLAPWTTCAAFAVVPLTLNYGYLPTAATDTDVYCGALLNGTVYGSNTVGNPSCSHSYSGSNNLVAFTYLGPVTRPIHGYITY